MKVICSTLLIISSVLFYPNKTFGQVSDAEMISELQQVADRVAGKLMNCCSNWGGRDLKATVDFDNTKVSKLLGEISMPMTASWVGSISGIKYWISGTLIIGKGGFEWQKKSDSGGFPPNCGKNCVN